VALAIGCGQPPTEPVDAAVDSVGHDADTAGSDADTTGADADAARSDADERDADERDGGVNADADDGDTAAPVLTRLTAEELHAQLETKDFLLINVHIPYAGQIPGTDAHVPYTDIDALVATIGDDRGTKVVLYCLTGPMSVAAGEALVELGYSRVFDLIGGMNAWREAGYELEP